MVHHLGAELFSGNVRAEKQGQIIMILVNYEDLPTASPLQSQGFWEEPLPKSPHFRNGYVWTWSINTIPQISPFKWTHDNKPLHFGGMWYVPDFQTQISFLKSPWFSWTARRALKPAPVSGVIAYILREVAKVPESFDDGTGLLESAISELSDHWKVGHMGNYYNVCIWYVIWFFHMFVSYDEKK